ncbi:MAG: L,D-transpeptidase [Rhizobiaceae bacterium]
MGSQKLNLARSGTFARLAGLCIVAVGLQACSSSNTLTSGYGSTLSTSELQARALTETSASILLSQRLQGSRRNTVQFDYSTIYASVIDEGIHIPAFDYTRMNSKYLRQEVPYFGGEPAGSIIVDARRRHLYLIQPGKMAIRYGIAVGKEGFGWTGSSVLQWKQKWPTWTPPPEMIERKPELQKYADGLKGSTKNPLGARAMYLYKNGRDTMYRIHGTTQPYSIGKAASSGCFRMINQDVIDLYERVGTRVVVQVRPEVKTSLLDRDPDA